MLLRDAELQQNAPVHRAEDEDERNEQRAISRHDVFGAIRNAKAGLVDAFLALRAECDKILFPGVSFRSNCASVTFGVSDQLDGEQAVGLAGRTQF